MAQALVTVGTRVYNHGDMANPSHHGTITRIIPASNYAPQQVEITRDEPMDGFKDSYVVYASMVGDEFKGHSGTRIVTETAYQIWRLERLANINA